MKQRRAFTLVELLIVLSIMSLLLTIALGAIKGARRAVRHKTILANLKQIDDAKELCTWEKSAGTGDTSLCSAAVLTAEYLKNGWPPPTVGNTAFADGSWSEASGGYAAQPIGTPATFRGANFEWWKANPYDWVLY